MRRFAWREKHARGTLSVLVSCVVHTALFIMLAMLAIASRPTSQHIVLQAAIAGGEEVALEYAEVPTIEPAAGELPVSIAPPAQELDLNVNAQLAQSQQSINATLTSALAAMDKQIGSTAGVAGRSSGAELGKSLSKLGANFFGSYAQGERFVFVLDSSRSMTGDRWLYACQELMDSVTRLQPHQRFYVICFDERTTCMFNTPPSRATYHESDESTRRRLKSWLKTKSLGRGTFPAVAMSMALKMRPDAIFMLSDGELHDDTLVRLRTLNGFSSERRQIPVHTIHLMSLEGRATLETLAMENAGSFTPVQSGAGF